MIRPQKQVKKGKQKPPAIANLIITSTDINEINKYVANLEELTKSIHAYYAGPVSFKTKVLKLNTRRASSGEGSGTRFYYSRKVWKKGIRLYHERVVHHVLSEQSNQQAIHLDLELM